MLAIRRVVSLNTRGKSAVSLLLLPSKRSFAASMSGSAIQQLQPGDFQVILRDPAQLAAYQVVDVREPNELEVSNFGEYQKIIVNLPLSEASTWKQQAATGQLLDATKPTVVICHHGRRSMMAATMLEAAGFEKLYNLDGGIHKFAVEVDSTIALY